MSSHLRAWHCEECDEYFDNPEQYLSDDIPSCPFCKSESICEVQEIASATLKVTERQSLMSEQLTNTELLNLRKKYADWLAEAKGMQKSWPRQMLAVIDELIELRAKARGES